MLSRCGEFGSIWSGGLTYSFANIAIHTMFHDSQHRSRIGDARTKVPPHSLFVIAVMIPTVLVSVLVGTHAFEVMVCTFAYSTVDAAPPAANWMYFAFVNYATL